MYILLSFIWRVKKEKKLFSGTQERASGVGRRDIQIRVNAGSPSSLINVLIFREKNIKYFIYPLVTFLKDSNQNI